MTSEPTLQPFDRLVGSWTTEATHPAAPGLVDPPGTAPASASPSRHFDSRGVFRVYDVSIDDASWRFWRNAPGSRNG